MKTPKVMRYTAPSLFEHILSKPADPVKGAFRQKLVSILSSSGEILPPADSPLGILSHLVHSPDTLIEECVAVVQLDPALTARIFRMANSAAIGSGANDLSQALFQLGFSRLREVVFTAGVLGQLSTLKVPQGWEGFWLRNLLIARCCERIASIYFPTDGSEYMAGLMHDIGWLFLVTYFPDEYNQIASGEVTESDLLPFGHADIAAAIAARSRMPLRSVYGLLNHHHPISAESKYLKNPRDSARFLAAIILVCDQLADQCAAWESGSCAGLDSIRSIPEFLWLTSFGQDVDLAILMEEELPRSREIFEAFFAREPSSPTS